VDENNLTPIPVKMYRSEKRLTVAAPMPGLHPDDILVEIGDDGMLYIQSELRGEQKGVNEELLNEWQVGNYYRELALPDPVDGELTNVTYENGVLVIAMPLSDTLRAAQLFLDEAGRARGQRIAHKSHNIQRTSTEEHQAEQAAQYQDEPMQERRVGDQPA
jgi:HSP20 family protein